MNSVGRGPYSEIVTVAGEMGKVIIAIEMGSNIYICGE